MKKKILFRMLAYTAAAGKYCEGAVRDGNEDNFYADDNLSDDKPSHCIADKVTEMNDCGLLMVVADGMGGQNAGEVASQIAVDTVNDYFSPGKISEELAAEHAKRKQYMEMVIKEADERIKRDSKHNPERRGMGSTMIMAWIVNDKMTLSWCGDSRAYRYNPKTGIELLSHDHSYVQELADKGVIRYEDTFDHPQGNIVTRSLGDSSQKIRPDSLEFEVHNGDIIMLCSDGLSGVLRDKKQYDVDGNLYPEENIEDIIAANHSSLSECRKALWNAAERGNWYDNVTVVLCEILSGAKDVIPLKQEISATSVSSKYMTLKLTPKAIIMAAIILLFLVIGAIGGTYLFMREYDNGNKENTIADVPSMQYADFRNLLFYKLDNMRSGLPPTEFSVSLFEEYAERLSQTKDDSLEYFKQDLELLEAKLPYLKNIEERLIYLEEEKNNAKPIKENNRRIQECKSALENLREEILNSNVITDEEWDKRINGIEYKPIQAQSIIENKPESTEVPDDEEEEPEPYEITFSPTIGQNDTYDSFIRVCEQKHPGYKVDTIKEPQSNFLIDKSNFNYFRRSLVNVTMRKDELTRVSTYEHIKK